MPPQISHATARQIAGPEVECERPPIEPGSFSGPERFVGDAVQAAAALKIGVDYVVTRDEKGFRALSIPSVNSGEILSLL